MWKHCPEIHNTGRDIKASHKNAMFKDARTFTCDPGTAARRELRACAGEHQVSLTDTSHH